jgi:hypothetical protein
MRQVCDGPGGRLRELRSLPRNAILNRCSGTERAISAGRGWGTAGRSRGPAARARVEGEDLAVVLAELFDDTGGPLTEQELVQARQRLALAEQR